MNIFDEADLENRFDYHPPESPRVVSAHAEIRRRVHGVAYFIADLLPAGREKSLAITSLEEAMFWANAGVARTQTELPEEGV